MIKYLIKFVSEEQHAEDLLDGNLFMYPAGHYHTLELGRGDIREGALSDSICFYQYINYPIYCLSYKTVCDFTALPFPDKAFKLVVFDPPHLTWAGEKSWTRLKYGCLDENWPQMIHDGFAECMRVLDDYGTLIFKWSEVQIPLKEVLKAIGHEPLFGHRSGKNMNTHWMAFMKMP